MLLYVYIHLGQRTAAPLLVGESPMVMVVVLLADDLVTVFVIVPWG